VGLDDAPAFGKADPDLALPAVNGTRVGCAVELHGDAGVVAAEGDDVEASDGAGETHGGAGFAEGFEFVGTIKVFGDTEAHHLGAAPEHGDEGVDIVRDESMFVAWVEGGEFGYDGWIVDGHWLVYAMGKSLRVGRICLPIAAETVWMGSLTTWLRRRRMATEQRM
jgi:hypothetical protein